MKDPKIDFRARFFYRTLILHAYTPKAIKEIMKLIPTKIDRCDYEKNSFARLYPVSLEKLLTDKVYKVRRDNVAKNTPIKRPADHIKLMWEELSYTIGSLK